MTSLFLQRNQNKSGQMSQLKHQHNNSSSIGKIKDDEVKLLRQRILVMEKRAKQKQLELNQLRQHMNSCPYSHLKRQNEETFVVGYQDFLGSSSSPSLTYTSVGPKPASTKSTKIQLALARQVQLSIQSQKLHHHSKVQQTKNSEDKLLIYNLQTKLHSYEKKHFILQQTLSQRTEEFQSELVRVKEKLKEERRVNSELMGKVEQLEWENDGLKGDVEEGLMEREQLMAKLQSSKITNGTQTERESFARSKMVVKQVDVKIGPSVNIKNKERNKLKTSANIMNVKVLPNDKFPLRPIKCHKMFIFSRQVYQKVFNTVNQKKKGSNHVQNKIEDQNPNRIRILHQSRSKPLLHQEDNKNRYRSITTYLPTLLQYQKQDINGKDNKKVESRNQCCEFVSLRQLNLPQSGIKKSYYQASTPIISTVSDFQRVNLDQRQGNLKQGYRSVSMTRNNDENKNQYLIKPIKIGQRVNTLSNNPTISSIDTLKNQSLTIRQDVVSNKGKHYQSIQNKHYNTSTESSELRKGVQSVSLKQLIVQKCRTNVLRC